MMYDMNQLVGAVRKLEKQKRDLVTAHKAEVAELDGKIEHVKTRILSQLDELGVENTRTESGTAFKKRVQTAGVDDWETLLAHIVESEDYSLLHKRVAANRCAEIVKETGQLPPGTKWSRDEVTVQIRAPK